MHAVNRVRREALEQAILHHGASAALVLLRRLEDEINRAVEIARLGEVFRRAQQHGRVPVMAAGMHLAGIAGPVFETVRLLDVERVHVGPDGDGALAVALSAQHGDDARLRDARVHGVHAEFLQLVRDEGGGAQLLERRFRIHVELAPPCGHFLVELGYAVDDGHCLLCLAMGRGWRWISPDPDRRVKRRGW